MENKADQNPLLLSINIGNDVIQIGVSRLEEQIAVWHVATPSALTSDEAGILLNSFFQTNEYLDEISSSSKLDGAIIASTVPALTDAWVKAAQKVSASRPLLVGPGLKTALRMNYNDPAEVGADRIADIVAARTLFDGAFIIVDMGTTTNFMVVDSEGTFCGGIIAPGLKLSAEALSKGAARLNAIDLKAPKTIIGKSTRDAMRTGIIIGETVRIDGMIEKIWEELGYETEVIAAGLGVAEIAALTKHVQHVEENLTMRGLRLLYAMNCSNSKS